MKTISTPLLAILSLLPLLHAAKLQIVEAGVPQPWKTGPTLSTGDTICPPYPKISVVCTPDAPANWAEYTLNGNFVRRENVVPYTIGGDVGGVAFAWMYPENASIHCKTSTGEEVSVDVTFSCAEMATKAPSTTMQATEPPPATQQPMTAPPTTQGSAGVATPGGGDGCGTIKAVDFVMNKGWVKLDGGMAYKPGDASMGIDAAGVAPLTFKFVPGVTSRYAFTLDMRTNHPVDYNDVWGMIEGETLSLEKVGSVKEDGGWVKMYHNDNGRSVKAWTVDFDPHAISTKGVLKKGVEYVVKLSGRSTQVTVFNVVLFACQGVGCRNGAFWNEQISKCV